MIRIRHATRRREDSTALLSLIVGLAHFERLSPPTPAAKRRIIKDVFEKKRIRLLLAFDSHQKEAVGYALYFFTYSSFLARPVLYLEDIYVREAFRGKGIGRKLFLECVREASRNKCGRMEWSVLTWNKNAIRFYEKAGARRLKEWHYYRLDSDAIKELS